MMKTNDVRKTFLDYFEKNGHTAVKSSPLVPDNDPTLMFTNAGMNQFKNVFTGNEKRDYTRACSSQKCVRAGGKHNDLDNVGHTVRHHTFFEMLGNFSFGDYFKEEAIYLAWNLITKEYGLPKEKLLATVYHTDDEAYDLWKKIAGFGDDKIIRIPTKDNFWSMGDTGPCGPCSEIFYDHGDKIWGGRPGTPEEDGDRFIEIWNLVFMQYEQLASGEQINLPKPSIDTGMGLERIAATINGSNDNYTTDTFVNLIKASADVCGNDVDGTHKISHRVVADHLRSSAFLIADGVLPSNEGRGYVLRRIMRRAMRHAHMMGCQDPLMHRLVPALVSEMGDHFTELKRAEALITETLKLEEERFKNTLGRGLKLLDGEVEGLGRGQALDGETAFKLYDTYGFPLDLTQDVLRAKEIKVDVDGFNKAMERQKEEARKAWSGSGDAGTEKLWFELKEEFGATEFLGYSQDKAEAVVQAIVKDGKKIEVAKKGDEVYIIANQTPFYGESGGQVGDRGFIFGDGFELEVKDVKKHADGLFVHHVDVEKGEVKVGDVAEFVINRGYRKDIKANHSATHILQFALRRVLGEHVTQKGSEVRDDGLRFDISHPKQITKEEIHKIENLVNGFIRDNCEVKTKIMNPEAAVEAGAMALFGEKYGDEVRVVTMEGDYENLSVELCGGTHVSRTGDIGYFKIVNESALAAGVRRIEAVTGYLAELQAVENLYRLQDLAHSLKSPLNDVENKVTSLLDENKKMQEEIKNLRKKLATGGSSAANDVEEINGVKFVAKELSDIPAKDLKGIVDEVKSSIKSGVVVVASKTDGKTSVVVGVTEDMTGKYDAGKLIREAGVRGGGKAGMAQGGLPETATVEEIVSTIKSLI